MTVAAFMDLALYDPECGYYARAAQRSGRAGDFFTSVDVGPLFGELLEIQIAEMADLLTAACRPPTADFDLVEAAAGNARLSADILQASRRRDSTFYNRIRLHLVEASAHARAVARATLGDVADRLVSSSDSLPPTFTGVLFANELLDALPVHQVVMRPEGLREIYVDVADRQRRSVLDTPERDGARASAAGVGPRGNKKGGAPLVTFEDSPSTPELSEYFDRLGVRLEPGWRTEINLRAVDWVRNAARRLSRGFMMIIDYGHDARDLYSAGHADGTLTTFVRHVAAGPADPAAAPAWLQNPGQQDITAHVDFTSIRAAAEAEGLTTLGFLDQTYFLLGLLERGSQGSRGSPGSLGSQGSNPGNSVNPVNSVNYANLKQSLALKTLLMPGGLGSTHKVLILGKDVGAPQLAGCSYRMRVT